MTDGEKKEDKMKMEELKRVNKAQAQEIKELKDQLHRLTKSSTGMSRLK